MHQSSFICDAFLIAHQIGNAFLSPAATANDQIVESDSFRRLSIFLYERYLFS
jgi:hypothetical protein